MPPKKKPNDGAKAKPAAKRKMPPPMCKGECLTDFTKKTSWVLGESIGKGGFGEIYSASKSGDKSGKYVIKIEPAENGPLFTELSFYTRVAKPSAISEWCSSNGLSYLSVPEFVSSGLHTHLAQEYRFMAMHQYGEDIEKKFTAAGGQFGMKTVCYLALRLLEALEFLHHWEYVHADVKGSNLLTGLVHPHQVYLVDYGLAYRYLNDGVHKTYSEDPRRRHDGTIEFTSIDAHNGVNPSRRGDLEIMGYCLLQWAAGRLPWEDNLEDKDYVAREKKRYKSKVGQLMTDCFTNNPIPLCLKDFMKQVFKLDYTQDPNYSLLKSLFEKELKRIGSKDDHKNLDWLTSESSRKRSSASGASPALVKKRKKEAAGKRKIEAVEEEVDGDSSSDELPVVSKLSLKRPPSDIEEDKPTAQRRKKAGAKEAVDQRPPVKKAPPIKSQQAKSGSGLVKQKPADTMPKAAYPPELGYSNGRDVKKAQKKQPVVEDKVVSSESTGLRRSTRNKPKL